MLSWFYTKEGKVLLQLENSQPYTARLCPKLCTQGFGFCQSGRLTRHCEGLSEGGKKKNKEICIKCVLIGLLDLQEIKTCHLETKTQKYMLKKASLNKFKSNFALNIHACIRATTGELSLAKRKMEEINQRLMDESKNFPRGIKLPQVSSTFLFLIETNIILLQR